MGILIIILCIFLIWIAVDFQFSLKKNIIYNNMDRYYVEIENYIIKNSLKVDHSLEHYLTNLQFLRKNKEFTDVQVLVMTLKSMSAESVREREKEIAKLDQGVPERIRELGTRFFSEAAKATRLSRFKPRFILFLVVKTISILISSLLMRSFNTFVHYLKILRKALSSTFQVERVVASHWSL